MRRSFVGIRRWCGPATTVAFLVPIAAAYLLRGWYIRLGTREEERLGALPGDDIVSDPCTGYTMAVTIRAPASDIWPWLVQVGQGRGGFYTYEWIENLFRANIRNTGSIVPSLQHLAVGDKIRLTPDPYLGQPGQFMIVAKIEPERVLVFKQRLPNASIASWAFVLRPEDAWTTRVLMRRRGGPPTMFDRVMAPGYVFMDRGMLQGLRARAESAAHRLSVLSPRDDDDDEQE